MNKENITTFISPPNTSVEILKKYFGQCFDKQGNFDIDKFKEEVSQKDDINFSKESFSMEFLGKSYARLLAVDEAVTLLQEDTVWNEQEENKDSENLLLKGDNLEVLKHLSNAYQEQVKMIYIDPPYNTGSDGFVYEDDRQFDVRTLMELSGVDEERAKRILQFTRSKSNSHSAWLTFMYPRLYIAKQLLRDDGVIFISIDDNEVAQLRLLMDEIFGEENFVGNFLWKKNKSGNQNANYLSVQHDYVMSYVKNKGKEKWKLPYSKDDLKDYKEKDEKGVFYWKPVKHSTRGKDVNLTWENKEYLIEKSVYNKETLLKLLEGDEADFRLNSKNELQLYSKTRLGEGVLPYSFLEPSKTPMTENGVAEITELFGISIFDNPKPTGLLKHFINLGSSSDSNDIILDFFAGSGTTADAVMQLNAQDKKEGKEGNRKFILVQLPENIDEKKSKTAYDFVKNELNVEKPTIFEITKERIIRASKKIREEHNLENTPEFNFKIFQTIPIWEDYKFDEVEFNEQTTLFNESKLKEEDIQTLLTTWKTYDGVPLTIPTKQIQLENYTAHFVDSKLYLMNAKFDTQHLKALINKIDEDREFDPKTIILFGYNFQSRVLREISENIKHYSNKKNSDINVIIRY